LHVWPQYLFAQAVPRDKTIPTIAAGLVRYQTITKGYAALVYYVIVKYYKWGGHMIQHEIKETPIKQRFSKIKRRITILTPGWKGASIAITIFATIMFFIQSYFFMGSRGFVDVLTGTSISLVVIVGIAGILAGAFHL